MNAGSVLAAAAGGLIVAGVGLLALGLRSRPVASRPSRVSITWWVRLSPQTKILAGIGIGAGVVVWLVTGWVIAVPLLAVAVPGVPFLLLSPTNRADIDRLSAMAQWSRALAGVLTVGVGLEQAIKRTGTSVPLPIRTDVHRLIARLNAGTGTQAALRRFADDLDEPTGDLVVTHLLLAANKRGPGLAGVLRDTAVSVEADVDARLKIEAERARPRATARWITLIAIGTMTFLVVVIGEYTRPLFETFVGSLVFTVLLTAMAVLLVWMRQMTVGMPPARLLSPWTSSPSSAPSSGESSATSRPTGSIGP